MGIRRLRYFVADVSQESDGGSSVKSSGSVWPETKRQPLKLTFASATEGGHAIAAITAGKRGLFWWPKKSQSFMERLTC